MAIHVRRLLAVLTVVVTVSLAAANVPPATPTVIEPAADGRVVSAADVHMEATGFADPDPGDVHLCSDWAIWTVTPLERVWFADCTSGTDRVHIHLGDGSFENAFAGRLDLEPGRDYLLRVRFGDSSGDLATRWSPAAARSFSTASASQVSPLRLEGVTPVPPPTWTDGAGAPVVLPAGMPPPSVRLEDPGGALLLGIAGLDGTANAVVIAAPQPAHVPVRLRVDAGSTGGSLVLPDTDLTFSAEDGAVRTVVLPGVDLAPGTSAYFWISENGSTHVGSATQSVPDFSILARGAAVPWAVRQPGFKVEVVATGFQLPVNVAFVPSPGADPGDPFFYVNELYGTIAVVRRDGTVGDYATGLLNFNPTGDFPGSGEQGLTGLAVDPASGDVFASMLYSSNPADESALHHPKVVRCHSVDGGVSAATVTTIFDGFPEDQGASHQISNLSIGPDGKLYVHVGDGFSAALSQNLGSIRGKILRLNLDGTPAPGNPLFDPSDGLNTFDALFAWGFRNPFGGAWRSLDGAHYEVENGPTVDRFAKVVSGRNYGWVNTDASMATFAIYNWSPAVAPVNLAFVQPETYGGSGFPADKQDHAFVTTSGATWGSGPADLGKRLVEFTLDADGNRTSGPTPLVEYDGSGKATAAGLAAGPDGLYFTDLYKDAGYVTPIDRGANVLRVKFVGVADFTPDLTVADAPPVAVHFADRSTVPNPTGWLWDFGDGGTSTERDPVHTYTRSGSYDVRLTVTGPAGVAVRRRPGLITIGTDSRWEIAFRGHERGVGWLSLAPDGSLTGYGIRRGCAALFALSGVWSRNGTGALTASYTEQCGAQLTPGTFRGRMRDGSHLSVSGLQGGRRLAWRGTRPADSGDLTGTWDAKVWETGRMSGSDVYAIAAVRTPRLFDFTGASATGQLMVTSRGKAAAYGATPTSGTYTAAGRVDAASGKVWLRGSYPSGSQVSVQATKR